MILLSNIYDFIIDHFDSEELINTISCSPYDEIGTQKQTIYPLVNIELITLPTDIESNLLSFEFAITAVTERDFDKKIKSTKLIGADNKIDNQNEMHYVLQKFITKVSRSNNINSIDIASVGNIELIDGAFTTVLDGFKCDITFTIFNPISIC